MVAELSVVVYELLPPAGVGTLMRTAGDLEAFISISTCTVQGCYDGSMLVMLVHVGKSILS